MSDLLHRAQEIFDQAVEVPTVNRTEFVAEACGEDRQLQAEVESLLSHDSRARVGFMETLSPLDGDPDRDDESVTATTPQVPTQQESFPEITGYKFLRRLHQGGQGVVYEALQRSTKRKVAIKLLIGGSHASPSARRRFEREIDLVAQLKHPNIITVFDSGLTEEGHPFCVMNYVRGVSLSEFVRQRKLNLEDALRLFGQVCQAVQYAHQRGVIHRDLKPSNILVDGNGQPHVLDFGLAKPLIAPEDTMVTVSRAVMGTLPYLSPEQARGNPDEIDTRTDVYALGVILYEILTGHYPYPVVGQLAEILRNITDSPPTPPSRTWSIDSGVTKRSSGRLRVGACPIDDEVQTIVLKALAKERDRRYQSASDLARDIGHYLSGEPIEAKRDSIWYFASKTARRYKFHVGLSTLFGVLIVSVVVLLNLIITKDREIGLRTFGNLNAGETAEKTGFSEAGRKLLAGTTWELSSCIDKEDWDGAFKIVDEHLHQDPRDTLLLAYRGYIQLKLFDSARKLKQMDVALQQLNNALKDYRAVADSNSQLKPAAHEGMGNVYYLRAMYGQADSRVDKYTKAIREYGTAISLNSGYLRAYSNRGHAYFELRQWDKAVLDYQKATSLGPKDLRNDVPDAWRTYYNYGTAQRIRNQAIMAPGIFTLSTNEAPTDLYCDVALALALYDVGRIGQAKNVLAVAIDKGGENEWILNVTKCLAGQLSPKQLVEAAGDNENFRCEAFYYGGEHLLQIGEPEQARESFQRCLDLEKTNNNEHLLAQWRLKKMPDATAATNGS